MGGNLIAQLGFAAAALAGACAVRFAFDPWLGDHLPYITFFAAITAIGTLTSLRVTLAGIVAAQLVVDYFFVAPRWQFGFVNADARYWIGTISFLVVSLLIASLCELLRQSGARAQQTGRNLDAILRSLGDGFLVLHADWRILYVNDEIVSRFGKPRDALLDQNLWDVFPDAISGEAHRQLSRAMNERSSIEYQVFYEPGGRWFLDRAFPREDGGLAVLSRDITERKRAEDDLRRNAALLAAINNTTSELIYVKDQQSRLIYANPATLAAIGKSQEEAIGSNELDRYSNAAEAEAIMANDRRIMAAGVPESIEELYTGPHGTRVYLSTKTPLRDESGAVVGVIGVSHDLTERRALEQLNQEQKLILEMIATGRPLADCLVAMTAIVGRFGATTRAAILVANANRTAISECFADRLPKQFTDSICGAPLSAEDFGTCGTAIYRGEPIGCSDVEQEDRWSPIWRELCLAHGIRGCHSTPIFGNQRIPVASMMLCFADPRAPSARELQVADFVAYAAGIAIDREQSARALRESEELFRTMGEAVPDFLWMADGSGQPIYQNPAWHAYVGLTHEELTERGWKVIHHPEDLPSLMELWQNAVAKGEAFHVEARTRRHDGEYRWFAGRTVPLKDESGNVVKWVGTMTDIHDLKEAGRHKDEFLATLAHELRNPLAPIRGSLEILRLAGADPTVREQVLATMERQVNQMVRLIDDLMEVSRITRGKLDLRKERVELNSIVRDAVESVTPLLTAAGHHLEIALPQEVFSLNADRVRLGQVLVNLLNNAIKYTNEGGRIHLAAHREGEFVEITVADSGMGIPPEMVSKVFDLFTQIDRTLGRAQGGLGIGLALVKRLVEMHGGTVTAISEGPEKGSQFTVRLPLAVDAIAATPADDSLPTISQLAACRIVVVDDNRDVADTLGMLLRLMGAEVTTLYDSTTAVEVVDALRPEVVFLDLGMPIMSGYDVASELRKRTHFQETKLIALTGWGQEEDRRRSRAAGFDHHLVKPPDAQALQKLLVEVRNGARCG